MNATLYQEDGFKLKTIQENHSEEQQTVQKIINTSPINTILKKNQFNTLEKQYGLSSLSQKKKLFDYDSNNQDTINHRNSITRHKRNKTQTDVKNKNKQKDPVYNCLYVPFLQTKAFEMKKSISKKSKFQNSLSAQKQKIIQPFQLQSQRSYSQPNNKNQQKQKILSLPGINKNIKFNNTDQMNKKRFSAPRIEGNQTSNSIKVNLAKFNPSKNFKMIGKSDQNTSQEKNLRQFKLRDRQNKMKIKKPSKKVEEWKQINFLQLKTCYYHIDKRMGSLINTSKDQSHSTINEFVKKNSDQKSLKRQLLIYQRNPKIPKFPNSSEEVSLTVKNFSSIRKNKISIDELIKSKNFKVKYVEKNMLYFGQMVNDEFNGYGILVKPDEMFQGTWVDGKRIQGTQCKKGIFFQGRYVDNKKQGFGLSYWNQGLDEYSGEWKNGQKNGNGVWKNLDGDQYIGQWINGKVQGYGVHTTADGQKYQGYFVNFLKHGQGKQRFPNGDYFQGNFFQGKPEGNGVYYFNKGQVKYEGMFSKGLRIGKGKLTVPNLFNYEGQFQNDIVHGYGKISYLNNDSYLGNFKQGLRHGNGTFHNVRQNIILTGIWNKGQFFKK